MKIYELWYHAAWSEPDRLGLFTTSSAAWEFADENGYPLEYCAVIEIEVIV